MHFVANNEIMISLLEVMQVDISLWEPPTTTARRASKYRKMEISTIYVSRYRL